MNNITSITLSLLACLAFTICGCGDAAAPVADNDTTTELDEHAGHDHGPGEHEEVAGHDHSGWWCPEHGVPEEECALCDTTLVASYKADGTGVRITTDPTRTASSVTQASLKPSPPATRRSTAKRRGSGQSELLGKLSLVKMTSVSQTARSVRRGLSGGHTEGGSFSPAKPACRDGQANEVGLPKRHRPGIGAGAKLTE